ncbi:hypothetical protein ILUMI_14261, partial [Ignelater luminosus]
QEENRAYRMIKDELCTMWNILLRGTRIVIPESLRQLVLKLGHEGYPGMVKMKGTLVGTVMTYQLPKQVRRTTTKMSQVEHDSIRRESSMEPK